jgi:ATP-dependent DNA ligase
MRSSTFFDKEGRPSFNILQHQASTKHSVFVCAFDLLAYRKRDVRGLPLQRRRELLNVLLANASDPIRISAVFRDSPKDLIRALRKRAWRV